GPSGPQTAYTGAGGSYCFTINKPGSHTVTEYAPSVSWVATTPVFKTFPCGGGEAKFGNVCVGAGGGLTLGFWSNKNGENKINDAPNGAADELAMLSALCLKNAGPAPNGSDFNPTTYAQLKTWLLAANATNMAYMLSAQLAAMELNVESGGVNPASIVYMPTG